MQRRSFLASLAGLLAAPFVSLEKPEPVWDPASTSGSVTTWIVTCRDPDGSFSMEQIPVTTSRSA